uniref:Uncharacterized protein n=1 Tax=Human betaherpesvirus 6 TaxID=10368 RepID=A0A1W6G3F1_9BETA|nr:hypothetical protein [Human betaherpesvirus 6]
MIDSIFSRTTGTDRAKRVSSSRDTSAVRSQESIKTGIDRAQVEPKHELTIKVSQLPVCCITPKHGKLAGDRNFT